MRFALYGVFLNIMSSVKSVFSSLITSRYFVYCLFFYGIFLRLVLYFQNRSFWIDDAALATKIISYNYSQLFFFYEGGQAAPPLFFLISKCLTGLLGTSEYIFRFFPLITGIASLFLFYRVANIYFPHIYRLLCFILFLFSDNLIYYSTEFKQYHTDVFAVLVMLLLYHQWNSHITFKRSALFAVFGALLVWLSHGVFFMCVTLGFLIFKSCFFPLSSNQIKQQCWVPIVWGVSFITHYFMVATHVASSSMNTYWAYTFFPIIPSNLFDFLWLPINLFRFCCYFLGLRLTIISGYINDILALSFMDQLQFYINHAPIFMYIIFFWNNCFVFIYYWCLFSL